MDLGAGVGDEAQWRGGEAFGQRVSERVGSHLKYVRNGFERILSQRS